MKYIVHKELGPILFQAKFDHNVIAEKLGISKSDIVSAGLYFAFPECSKAIPGSMTLGIAGQENDKKLIDDSLLP